MTKEQKEYPIDPRGLDDILWELLLKEHDVYDHIEGGKKVRTEWLKQWFISLKSKLLEPKYTPHEQAKEGPQKTEKATGIIGKKRTNY